MESKQSKTSAPSTKQPIWLALLRIAVGIIILLKGIAFFKDSTAIETLVQNPDFSLLKNNAAAIAFFITYFNLLGGFFITVGLFTRWVSLLQIPLLVGAIIFVNSEAGMSFSNPELALSILVLILLALFVLKGSGPYSADEFFRSYTNAGHKSGYTKKFFQ
jgi:putative oxidoreductase